MDDEEKIKENSEARQYVECLEWIEEWLLGKEVVELTGFRGSWRG